MTAYNGVIQICTYTFLLLNCENFLAQKRLTILKQMPSYYSLPRHAYKDKYQYLFPSSDTYRQGEEITLTLWPCNSSPFFLGEIYVLGCCSSNRDNGTHYDTPPP